MRQTGQTMSYWYTELSGHQAVAEDIHQIFHENYFFGLLSLQRRHDLLKHASPGQYLLACDYQTYPTQSWFVICVATGTENIRLLRVRNAIVGRDSRRVQYVVDLGNSAKGKKKLFHADRLIDLIVDLVIADEGLLTPLLERNVERRLANQEYIWIRPLVPALRTNDNKSVIDYCNSISHDILQHAFLLAFVRPQLYEPSPAIMSVWPPALTCFFCIFQLLNVK